VHKHIVEGASEKAFGDFSSLLFLDDFNQLLRRDAQKSWANFRTTILFNSFSCSCENVAPAFETLNTLHLDVLGLRQRIKLNYPARDLRGFHCQVLSLRENKKAEGFVTSHNLTLGRDTRKFCERSLIRTVSNQYNRKMQSN